MDIQRGDQVYYRGEVWTVGREWRMPTGEQHLFIQRMHEDGKMRWFGVDADMVQRVEQVR